MIHGKMYKYSPTTYCGIPLRELVDVILPFPDEVGCHPRVRALVTPVACPWKIWDYDCVMHQWHGNDHTLCGDDIDGIIALYGSD